MQKHKGGEMHSGGGAGGTLESSRDSRGVEQPHEDSPELDDDVGSSGAVGCQIGVRYLLRIYLFCLFKEPVFRLFKFSLFNFLMILVLF